ncbi:MAG: TRZ/ATZ family hydrolase [Gammaproteobacteria bacterium]
MNVDSLISAKWIVPVEPDDTVFENHALVIHEGTILDLLPTDEALQKYRPETVHECPDHVLIPGLINTHTHAAMTLFRGLADDLPLMDWLNNHMWPAEQRWVDPQFVEDGSRLAIAEMLRGGTTCFADMYFFPDRTAAVAVEAGIRAVVGLIMIDFPTAWARDVDEYFAKGEEVHDNFKHNPLIKTAFAPHSPYMVSEKPLTRIAVLAEELNIPIHMHVHETEDEINQSIDLHGKRPLQRLQDMNLLGPRLMAVHMTQVELEEFELLARYGVHVIHCPESNLKLASGFCPVFELQHAGVNIALGTDGAASNNDLDIIGEMHTAALLGKGVAASSAALSARSILRMATINAARALDWDDRIGSLEIGKEADVAAVDLSCIETQPLYDPVSQLVYAAGRHQVSDVWISGRQLLCKRELQTIDEDQVCHRTAEWNRKLKER